MPKTPTKKPTKKKNTVKAGLKKLSGDMHKKLTKGIKPKKKNKGGRPKGSSKSTKEKLSKITADFRMVAQLVSFGLKDTQIAKTLGIGLRTLDRWKADKGFMAVLKESKELYDSQVVAALHKNAIGVTTKNLKAVVVSDGKDCGSHVEMHIEEIEHPPNPTSMIFWLKNRQPEQWRDKTEIESSNNIRLERKFADYSDEEMKEALRKALC